MIRINNPWLKVIITVLPLSTLLVFIMAHFVVVTSPSIEYRILWRTSQPAQKGDYALFELMVTPSIPSILTKKIACGPGDTLSIRSPNIYCDNTLIATTREYIQEEKIRPYSDLEMVIPEGKGFALGTHPNSFDSRYFGLIDLNTTQKLIPLF